MLSRVGQGTPTAQSRGRWPGKKAALGATRRPKLVFAHTTCPADFICSGHLEAQDIFDFLGAWVALDPRANFNGVNGINAQDIFDYLNGWFAGCQ